MNRRGFIKSSSCLVSSMVLPISVSGWNKGVVGVNFGLATDSHYAEREPQGTRYYRNSLDKMLEFVEEMNAQKPDFLIHLGDFKDEDPNKNSKDTLRYLNEIEAVYAQFDGPRYHCVGNHDVDSITKPQLLANIVNTGITKQESYYSFDRGGIHFVVLDANYHKDGRDHFYREGADWQDTNIPEKEVEWLSRDLESTSNPVVIFSHHALHEYVIGDHKYHINNFAVIQKMLAESGKVLAVFQGHSHEDKLVKENGIYYITTLGMVDYEGLENNSFALVEVSDSQLRINGYKRVRDQSLPF